MHAYSMVWFWCGSQKAGRLICFSVWLMDSSDRDQRPSSSNAAGRTQEDGWIASTQLFFLQPPPLHRNVKRIHGRRNICWKWKMKAEMDPVNKRWQEEKERISDGDVASYYSWSRRSHDSTRAFIFWAMARTLYASSVILVLSTTLVSLSFPEKSNIFNFD